MAKFSTAGTPAHAVGPGRTGSGNLDSLAPRRFRRWRFIVLAVVSLAVALSARSLRAALAGQPVKAGAAHVGATSRATTLEAAAATDGVRRNIQHHTVTEQTFAAPTAAQPADAAVAAGLRRVPPALGTTSAKWQPLVLSECVEGMPRHWAPCLVGSPKRPALVYGEELLYPDFSVEIPRFLSEDDKAWWLQHLREDRPAAITERFMISGDRAYFRGQNGQNLVLRNVIFRSVVHMDGWDPRACMERSTTLQGIAPLPPGQAPEWPGRTVLANTPDSWSYQHFLDRVVKLLAHTETWRQEGTRVVSGGTPNIPHVQDVWRTLLQQGGQQQAVHGVAQFSAEELVVGCRCPLEHPYFPARLRELMQLPQPVPLDERKTVLYLSRNSDVKGNGGRKVLNEQALLEAIRAVLEERALGEELVLFDKERFPHVQDVMAFLVTNVSAVIGPHGGKWHNAMSWAAPDTFMLEFLPKDFYTTVVWEEAAMIGAQVTVLPVEPADKEHNMEIPPELVADALRRWLGQPPQEGAGPQLLYKWDLEQYRRRR